MLESQRDLWTKQLIGTALRELGVFLDDAERSPELIGRLSQRVGAVISEDPPANGARARESLAEELSLSVYLTVAAEGPGAEIDPRLLAALKEGLTRTLAELEPDESA